MHFKQSVSLEVELSKTSDEIHKQNNRNKTTTKTKKKKKEKQTHKQRNFVDFKK